LASLYPQHPANQSVLALARAKLLATEFPDQIALLLPLSGRAEAVGVAGARWFHRGISNNSLARARA